MALGTNYARGATAKQQERFDFRWASYCASQGETKEQFLARFKEYAQPKQAQIWDKVLKMQNK